MIMWPLITEKLASDNSRSWTSTNIRMDNDSEKIRKSLEVGSVPILAASSSRWGGYYASRLWHLILVCHSYSILICYAMPVAYHSVMPFPLHTLAPCHAIRLSTVITWSLHAIGCRYHKTIIDNYIYIAILSEQDYCRYNTGTNTSLERVWKWKL